MSRQTDRQTHEQTDRHTYTLITVLCPTYRWRSKKSGGL